MSRANLHENQACPFFVTRTGVRSQTYCENRISASAHEEKAGEYAVPTNSAMTSTCSSKFKPSARRTNRKTKCQSDASEFYSHRIDKQDARAIGHVPAPPQ